MEKGKNQKSFPSFTVRQSFASLTGQYGDRTKIIYLIRHGIKNGEHIDRDCLDSIMDHGFDGLSNAINVIHHGTDFVRTDETASAATIWLSRHGGGVEKHLNKSSVLGGKELMNLITPEVRKRIKEGTPNYRSLLEINPAGFFSWRKEVTQTIINVFPYLDYGDKCLMVGHTPVIETVFNLFCPPGKTDVDMEVRELDGIFLVERNDGQIVAYR